MSKYIENYHIKDFDNGIRLLLFNTKNRWIKYQKISTVLYNFWDQDENGININEETVEINFPKFTLNESYLSTEIQEKDQISFYFIPFSLITNGNLLNITNKIKIV